MNSKNAANLTKQKIRTEYLDRLDYQRNQAAQLSAETKVLEMKEQ
jgi:hypothetical protein